MLAVYKTTGDMDYFDFIKFSGNPSDKEFNALGKELSSIQNEILTELNQQKPLESYKVLGVIN